jgi:hypothetical protein
MLSGRRTRQFAARLEDMVNPVTVHLPREWIDRIEAMAERDERSRQAQLRWLLRQALDQIEGRKD